MPIIFIELIDKYLMKGYVRGLREFSLDIYPKSSTCI